MEEQGLTPPPCVFCEIAAHRAPAYTVYETERTLAFLDLFPYTRGHLLVVPKRHVDRLTDLRPEEYPDYVGSLAELCRRVDRFSRHYNVALNQGEMAGQVIFHLHFHVIPRYGAHNPFLAQPRARLADAEARRVVAELSKP
ncbi:MAG: HIT family protein [Thermoplasmata archaeon]|nr:HIT family protein [Thermoplasmata archaeon]